jgi:hypothetical protein
MSFWIEEFQRWFKVSRVYIETKFLYEIGLSVVIGKD